MSVEEGSSSRSTKIERLETIALWFTCTIGVCMGIVALVGGLMEGKNPAWLDTLEAILLLCVMGGGMTMGALALAGWAVRRKAG